MVQFNSIIGTILSPLTKSPIPASSTLSLSPKKYKLQFFNSTYEPKMERINCFRNKNVKYNLITIKFEEKGNSF